VAFFIIKIEKRIEAAVKFLG